MSARLPDSPLPIAVLISGGGTTLRNLIDRIDAGLLPAAIRLVVSSNADAKGLEFARRAGIAARVVDPRQFGGVRDFSAAIFEECRKSAAALVVLAGFLKLLEVPPDFEGRVMNIHPALIPACCGKGFYGRRVHEAVLAQGLKLSGCTVHFVDNQYDHGPIILQRAVPVLEGDTPESLAARVFAAECEAYPEAIRLYAEGRLKTEGQVVRVDHPATGA